MKKKWSDLKEQLNEALKLYILISVMIIGFLFIYCLIWMCVGLPMNQWGICACYGLSMLSEWLYLKWLGN